MEILTIFVKVALIALIFAASLAGSTDVDPNGYVVYCPCMGRFGNQFEQFLGALAFAKGLDRTLVLPPWIEFPPGSLRSKQVPFDTYIQVAKLKEYHRVLTMERFMKSLAPNLWPPGKRISFCYSARQSLSEKGGESSCNAKDGNPFGPFWDTFNIDFDHSEFYGPLYYDTWHQSSRENWDKKYPPSSFPVLAFTGPPAAFPVEERNAHLAQYTLWSNSVDSQAEEFIQENLKDLRPFLGLHLRIGSDFKNACNHISPGRHLFASPQCLGYRFEHGEVTEDLCLPSEKTIMAQLGRTIKKVKARAVFVATDTPSIVQKIQDKFKKKVKVFSLASANPHVDLAILTKSDHYIASCASTFSAIATRMRSTQDLGPTSFWALEKSHDEL